MAYKLGALTEFLSSKRKRKGSDPAKVESSFDKKIKVDKKLTSSEVAEKREESQIDVQSKSDKKVTVIESKFEELLTEEQNERTIFVGNLPLDITQKRLKQLFSSYGKIETIRMRSLFGLNPKLPKKVALIKKEFSKDKDAMNGYIKFKKKISVQNSLELNGHLVGNHHIRVDSCHGNTKYDNKCTVFIGNLPYLISDDDIHQFFSDCGQISAVRLVRDKNSGKGKGFGFVSFKDSSSMSLALKLNGDQFQNREIRIKPIMTKSKQAHQTVSFEKSAKKIKKKEGPKPAVKEDKVYTKKVKKLIKKKRNKRKGKSLL